MRWLCAAIAAYSSACGRIGFEARSDAASTIDAARTLVADYSSFTACPSELYLRGDATCMNGAIEITPPIMGAVGAVWLDPIRLSSTSKLFVEGRMDLTNGGGGSGDGFAFVMQTSASGADALGGLGDGLGFADIQPSVEVSFDPYANPWDPFPDTLGVHIDGDWEFPEQTANAGLDMSSAPFTFWIDYDGAANTLMVFVSTDARPATPQLTYAQDITHLGSPVWLGITASCGNAYEAHRLLALRIDAEL